MRRRPLTVGVLGGMGPIATHDFFGKVIAAARATTDEDHIRLLIDNNPFVPDRNAAALSGGPKPGPVLASMARALEAGGAGLLAMPCNAAHAYADDIRAAVSIPFIDMIAETVAAVRHQAPHARRVGVLAADGCLHARLYHDALGRAGLEAITLDAPSQADFMSLVYRVKGGDVSAHSRAAMRTLAAQLLHAGAEAVIAGCTEIPLALGQDDIAAPLVESTFTLANRVVELAREG